MHLEVSLSESDIGEVKVGQQATVTVNAASGEEVAGKVIDIDVLSSSPLVDRHVQRRQLPGHDRADPDDQGPARRA